MDDGDDGDGAWTREISDKESQQPLTLHPSFRKVGHFVRSQVYSGSRCLDEPIHAKATAVRKLEFAVLVDCM